MYLHRTEVFAYAMLTAVGAAKQCQTWRKQNNRRMATKQREIMALAQKVWLKNYRKTKQYLKVVSSGFLYL